jgi:hypothetical protein
VNNGQDWILSDVSFPLSTPIVKLVENHILAVELNQYFTASKIDLATNEVLSEDLGDNLSLVLGATIADDGTLYFQSLSFTTGDISLYKYQFGVGVTFLGYFNEVSNTLAMEVIEGDLSFFTPFRYYVFDGESLKEYSYAGLPEPQSGLSFTVSDNGYVYAILDYHRIFRSITPTVTTRDSRISVDVTISPNPANIFITVSESDNQQMFDSYAIYDMLGSYKEQSNEIKGRTVNISHLAPGIYMLMLKRNEVVIGFGKFIKQ